MLTLLILLVALALILIAIVKYDIHPFLALFVGAIIYGLMMQMPTDLILKSISEGFGGVMGSVGLLILLGVIMGYFSLKNGWRPSHCRPDFEMDWREICYPFSYAQWMDFIHSNFWG